jgi:hypothetical protein
MSFYVPRNVNYHRLLDQERIGDGHPIMLYNILGGARVGPVGDIFLYSDEVREFPCMALWQSRKDFIVVAESDGFPDDSVVRRCLGVPASNYVEVSTDDRDISQSLAVLLQALRGYRVFVRQQALHALERF